MKIKTKDLTIEPLDLTTEFAWAQRKFVACVQQKLNAGRPVRIIVLKARQVGISTATEALLFNWCFMHPGSNSLVLSKSTADSEYLFEMTKLMWDTWEFRHMFHENHKSVRRLSWEETGSSIKIATAKGREVGRGQTIHAAHCSEVAFWQHPESLMLSLNQAVPEKPGTLIVLESTANGAGNWFYEQWFAAKAGETDYIPLFFPWWMHPEYQITDTTLQLSELAEDERELLHEIPDIGVRQLAWRRWCIRNKCNNDLDQFKQEFPSTDHEAFLVTGRNVFALDSLEKCYDPEPGATGYLTPIRDPTKPQGKFFKDGRGPLTIFKYPAPDQRYIVSGDPTRTTWGDPACIQVLNWRSFEQVAVFHGAINPVDLAERLAELGYFYNTALINCEVEGGGISTLNMLTHKMFYPRVWRYRQGDRLPGTVTNAFGWSMNWQRKQAAIAYVKDMLGQGMLRLHDEVTYDQMFAYVVRDSGEFGPGTSSQHDDAVMALAIAVATIRMELESGRDPEKVYQAYGNPLELEGNIFQPGAYTPAPSGDLFGEPWWEAIGVDE